MVRAGSRSAAATPRRPFDFEAIAAAFAQDGFHRATMDSVARRAGVAKPTLYRYFDSKQQLFEATIAAECERLLEHLFEADEQAQRLPVQDQIRIAAEACFAYAAEHPEGLQLLFASAIDRSSAVADRIEQTIGQITNRVAEMFRAGLAARAAPSGQAAEVLAALTVGATGFVARSLVGHPDWDGDGVLDLTTELFTRALGGVSVEALARVEQPRRSPSGSGR